MRMSRLLTVIHARLATLAVAARLARLADLCRSRRWRRALRGLARAGLVPALALALVGDALAAPPVAPGPVFRPSDGGAAPAAAMDADGDFVVAWTADGLDGDSTFEGNIYARRYAADGTPRGGAFLVNAATEGDQDQPAVAMDADGDFIVAWASSSQASGSFFSDIVARRFAAAGEPGAELRVNLGSRTGQRAPSVAMDAAGEALVAWERAVPVGSGLAPTNIFARRLPAAGEPGAELLLNSDAVPQNSQPSVALDADGDGLIAWTAAGQDGDSTFATNVYARRLPAGAQPDPIFLVNATTPLNQSRPSAAVDAAGNAVIAWTSQGQDGDGTFATNVYARRFPLAGAPGPELGVNLTTQGSQHSPRAAIDADGDFVIAWSDAGSEFPGDLFLRQFNPDGSSADQDRQINGGTGRTGRLFGLADNDQGELVVAWGGVLARLYRLPAIRTVQTEADTTVSEAGLTDSFSVALRSVPASAVTVTLTPDLPRIDLGAGPGSPLQLRFEPNLEATLPISVTVAAVDDQAVDGTQTVRVAISSTGVGSGYDPTPLVTVDGAPAEAVLVRVLDDDLARYGVSSSVAGITEGAPIPVVFTIFRSPQLRVETSIPYRFGGTAIFGEDYAVVGGTAGAQGAEGVIAFGPGEITQTVIVGIRDDPVGEPNKSITFELGRPLPEGSGVVGFPLVVVTLADDDPAEVRVRQSEGSTRVVRGGSGDEITIALRTVPLAPVTVTLTPTSDQLNLGAGWGRPQRLTFQADASATNPQSVRVSTLGSDATAALGERAAIQLAAGSADPGYDRGARFTVDGRDAHELPVEIIGPPGLKAVFVYLPIITR